MRPIQKKKPADLGKIQALIDNVADCQQQAVSLKLGLIHYFLDMASTELKLLQNVDQRQARASVKEEDVSTDTPDTSH